MAIVFRLHTVVHIKVKFLHNLDKSTQNICLCQLICTLCAEQTFTQLVKGQMKI